LNLLEYLVNETFKGIVSQDKYFVEKVLKTKKSAF
jgi:hypothetical protein